MSRVVITELTTESTATAANANSTVNSWNTASSDIDATNVRYGGFDRRSLGSRSITPSDGRPTPLALAGPSAALAVIGLATLVTVGASNAEVGPIHNASAGDQLKVRFSFEYADSGAGALVQFMLGYATASGGPYTQVPVTQRNAQLNTAIIAGAGIAATIKRGSITIAHRFTTTTDTTLWMGLLYQLSGGTVTVRDVRGQARLRAR